MLCWRNCMVPSLERLISERIRIFFHSSDQTYKTFSSDVPSGIVQTSAMWRDPRSFPRFWRVSMEGFIPRRHQPVLFKARWAGRQALLNITPAHCCTGHLLMPQPRDTGGGAGQQVPHGILTRFPPEHLWGVGCVGKMRASVKVCIVCIGQLSG